MIPLTHSASAWSLLDQELDSWHEAGTRASFWWRDDDAIADTPQLRKLTNLAGAFDVPLALAVIPARVDSSLALFLRLQKHVSVLQHGYAHINHAANGAPKIELGGNHRLDSIKTELRQGLDILSTQFRGQFLPVLVPPWNRISPLIVTSLAETGFSGLSTMRAYKREAALTSLTQFNTHLDPVNWRHGGGFIGTHGALAQIVQHLYARRSGFRDRREPTGLLTHHLAQQADVWIFCERLLKHLQRHPAVEWKSAPAMWPQPAQR